MTHDRQIQQEADDISAAAPTVGAALAFCPCGADYLSGFAHEPDCDNRSKPEYDVRAKTVFAAPRYDVVTLDASLYLAREEFKASLTHLLQAGSTHTRCGDRAPSGMATVQKDGADVTCRRCRFVAGLPVKKTTKRKGRR